MADPVPGHRGPACYLAAESEGCTDYVEKTLSVRVPATAGGCFEASELLHELGHYALGDPMHSNGRWADVDAAFAQIVWDYAGAPPECVTRYHGDHERRVDVIRNEF